MHRKAWTGHRVSLTISLWVPKCIHPENARFHYNHIFLLYLHLFIPWLSQSKLKILTFRMTVITAQRFVCTVSLWSTNLGTQRGLLKLVTVFNIIQINWVFWLNIWIMKITTGIIFLKALWRLSLFSNPNVVHLLNKSDFYAGIKNLFFQIHKMNCNCSLCWSVDHM